MIYDDDQCEECGAARVSGSRLCADCTASFALSAGRQAGEKEMLIKELKVKNKKLTALCERLLDHITSQAIHAQSIEHFLRAGGEGKKRGIRDEKSRVHSDK